MSYKEKEGRVVHVFDRVTHIVDGQARLQFRLDNVRHSGQNRCMHFHYESPYVLLGLIGLLAALLLMLVDNRRRRIRLQELSDRLCTLIGSMPDIVYFKDADGRYVLVNQAFERFSQLKTSDVVGKTDHDLLPKDLAAACLISDQNALRARSPTRNEEVARRPWGETIVFETIKSPIADASGKAIGLVGVSRDITVQKRAQTEIQQSEARYRQLAEEAEDAIFVIRRDFLVEYVNSTAAGLMGQESSDIEGTPLAELLTSEAYPSFEGNLQIVIDSAKPMHSRHPMPTPNGSLWLDTKLVPIEGPDGKVSAVLGISRDISEYQAAEEKLERSEARYRAVVEDMPALVCRFQRGGILTFVNDAYCECFGKQREELLGVSFLQMLPEEDREVVDHILESLTPQSPTSSYEHRVVLPDGRVAWQRWIDRILFDEEGTIIEYQSIGMDITEAKRAEKTLQESHTELQRLTARLQDVREEQSKRIARIIHDELGQALTAVKMNATWLRKNLSSNEAARKRAADMEDLVDLVIREVQSITMQLRPTMLDHLGLPAALQWATEEFELRSGIRVYLDITGDFDLSDECTIGIFRITQELLTNVARHAKATRVDVTLIPQDEMLVLRVRDDGVGIPGGVLGDPTSFGLIEIRERSTHLGGATRIESSPGRGTEVTVTIPMHDKDHD